MSSGAAAWRPTKLLAIDVTPDDHPVGIEDGADEPLGSRLGARTVDKEIRAVGQAEHVERLVVANYRYVDRDHGPFAHRPVYQLAESDLARFERRIEKLDIRQRKLAALPLGLHGPDATACAHSAELHRRVRSCSGCSDLRDRLRRTRRRRERATPPVLRGERRPSRPFRCLAKRLVRSPRPRRAPLFARQPVQTTGLVQQMCVCQIALTVPSKRRNCNRQCE